MHPDTLKQILQEVAARNCTIEEAVERLRRWPSEDLGFANIDHHRHVRQGVPEVIFAGGKQSEETVKIAEALVREQAPLLVTRADTETLQRLVDNVSAGDPAGGTGWDGRQAVVVALCRYPSIPAIPEIRLR